jgi:two-component system CheB/CheR fusion protein
VKDQGIGIKPSDQKKIFDRFYRSKSNKKTAVDGYGIGLYFSKEIIRQHGGEIWLKSDDKKGSEFYFTLPLSCRKIIKT